MLRFFRDFLIYGFASILSKFAAIFLMPIYTSILSREEYGAMAMLLSVSGIIDIFANLNIHSGIARDYFEEGINRKLLVSTGFWSILFISFSMSIIMLTSCDFWIEDVLELNGFESCFIVLMLTFPLGSLMSYFSILTRYKKKPLLFSLGTLLKLVLQLTIAIYTIVFASLGVVGFFIATFISDLFALIYFSCLNKDLLSFTYNWRYIKRALLFSIPTLPAILAGWLDSSFGQILIGKYISLTDLGIYSIALQFASAFSLISVALQNVWSPFLFENYRSNNFQVSVKKIFLFFTTVVSLVSVTLALFSQEIILLLTNSSYLSACKYIALLCVPMGLYVLFPFASSGISISRETKYIGLSYVLGSVFNILFLFLLLPIWGVMGVILGLTISRLITYSLMYFVTMNKGLLILPNKYVFNFIFIQFVCLVLCETNVYLRIVVFLIICMFLIKLFSKEVSLKTCYNTIKLRFH